MTGLPDSSAHTRNYLARRVWRHRIRRNVRDAMQREWEQDHVRLTVSDEPLDAHWHGTYTCERWARWPNWIPFIGDRFERQCGKHAHVAVEILFKPDDPYGVTFRYCRRHGRRDASRYHA